MLVKSMLVRVFKIKHTFLKFENYLFIYTRHFMKELDFAVYSDVGGRSNNEDYYLAKTVNDSHLFIVADGLGGHGDGEIASRAAVEAIEKHLSADPSNDIIKAIEFANDTVIAKQQESDSKMKTTVALAQVGDCETVIANVGDTRIYAFQNGKLVYQSVDHSASQLAVFAGEISLDEIRGHVDRNVLIRAIGATENVKVDASVIDNSQFDTLLLCTDGFWEYVLETEMEDTLQSSASADKWLCKMCSIRQERAPKNCDNNTAIVIML